MLRDGREAASMLCSIDKENERYIYMSLWFTICCTRLETFGERLTLDDVMAEYEVTQTGARDGSNQAIDEPESFSRLVLPF